MAQVRMKSVSQDSRELAARLGEKSGRTVTRREADGISRLTNGFVAGEPAEHVVHGIMLATAGAAVTKNWPIAAVGLGFLIGLWLLGDSTN